MCLAQGHNAVTPVTLEPAAPRSEVKHSSTKPLRSPLDIHVCMFWLFVLMLYIPVNNFSVKLGPGQLSKYFKRTIAIIFLPINFSMYYG